MAVFVSCMSSDNCAIPYYVRAGYCGIAAGNYCEFQGPSVVWIKPLYIGRVIELREYNGYEDSDFYAIVWDDAENKPKRFNYASTSFWCEPEMRMTVADASKEIIEKYNKYRHEQEWQLRLKMRKDVANDRRDWRNRVKKISNECGMNYFNMLKLRHLGYDVSDRILDLFNPRIRSGFKLNLREQVKNWANGDSTHSYPLSKKQMNYI